MSPKTGRDETYSAHERLLLQVLSFCSSLTCEQILGRMVEFTPQTLLLTVEALNRRGDITLSRRGETYEIELQESRRAMGQINEPSDADPRCRI